MMTSQNTTPTPFPLQNFQSVRQALLNQQEIALLDVREEDTFAQAHPLFAANLPLARLALDARRRIPRLDTLIVVYDDGEGLAHRAAQTLQQLGYSQVHLLDGGLQGWQQAGGEVFKDVNVPSKAFGELVDAQRHTPMLSAQEVKALLDAQTNVVVLDARRFDEYQTMNIPTSISVPGAELVLRVGALAPDPRTRIIVNCAGRTRSIIGTQSLVNAGIPNPVAALRNGTIGWTLAGQTLEHGAARRATPVPEVQRLAAAQQARAVADRAGVKRAQLADVLRFRSETTRTSYCLDVRTPEEYAAGHLSGFASAPGGQLVQETDVTLPVRGARAVLADLDGVRANMTASWLAQMGWEVWVLDGLQATDCSETGQLPPPVPPSPHRYRRPYEGTDNPHEAMQGYLDWEYGLVAQLARDGTHGFKVL
ncbi:MAG: rhodanese-like domain-containing protein [Rhodoferax sp.]|uniref:rhodanese-like domain-containing protein n=1 Tax=Rhodoferax sp. TaxID=50421 RepID=UPI0008CB0226|nr:rhodanese-like domain-containing protein [Rhodoferax sp.]MDP2679520.1 rhodanese-like domain-containing protein [Rhodoferax sp.]OGB51772.1 MAG: thiosulfate sulfurtransferase [Burkholderiales bacterium RIFOXYD12_FULL_59_19]